VQNVIFITAILHFKCYYVIEVDMKLNTNKKEKEMTKWEFMENDQFTFMAETETIQEAILLFPLAADEGSIKIYDRHGEFTVQDGDHTIIVTTEVV